MRYLEYCGINRAKNIPSGNTTRGWDEKNIMNNEERKWLCYGSFHKSNQRICTDASMQFFRFTIVSEHDLESQRPLLSITSVT